MTAIWYEVLPITLVSQQTVLIQRRQEHKVTDWMIQNQPYVHPSKAVVNDVMNFFDGILSIDDIIVHSTSWRYEDESDNLVLTYLAVLPQGDWVERLAAQREIVVEPTGNVAIRYGDHLFPPQQIKQSHVIAHALDHLASLSTYDPAIQAKLEPEWKEVLRLRTRAAAGFR